MSRESIQQLMQEFEQNMVIDQGQECWSARTLCDLLSYKDWDKFQNVINKAKEACINAGGDPDMHFRHAAEIVMAGFGSKYKNDYQLSRWAAYLTAMNGDPRKERIAFAQVYFVARTQQAEVIEQKMLLHDRVAARRELAMSEADFSQAMHEIGLTGPEMAIVRSTGDRALFGGKSTEDMKRKYGMVDKKGGISKTPLGNRLPSVVQRGKAFAAELTKEKIKAGVRGQRYVARHHETHSLDVRAVMTKSGITPEDLPPEEDTQKLERQIKKDEQEALKAAGARRQLSMKAPEPISEPPAEPSAPAVKSPDGGEQQMLNFEN